MRLHPSQALARPCQFGRYELLSPLGKGGMAEVFLARARGPKGFERVLVIKRILPHLCADEEFVEMFVAEAKISSVLSHGNIVQVYEFGEAEGQLFLAIERVEGTDLRSLLKRLVRQGKAIAPSVAVYVATRLLDALAYAHTRTDGDGRLLGIVHRDVSPSNILVSRTGEVKLCDFGIAKIATHHTSTGRLKGKMAYMSPEQISGAPVDSRSDLWSVGVILWEMLAGRKLFLGDSDVDTLARVRSAPVPSLPRLGVPHEDRLREIVGSALERDPERRYLDAATFADNLMTLSALIGGDPRAELRQVVSEPDSRPSGEDSPVQDEPEPPIASAETAMLDRPDVATSATHQLPPPPEAPRWATGETGTSPSESLVRPVRGGMATWLVILVAAAALSAIIAFVGILLTTDRSPQPSGASAARTSVPLGQPTPSPSPPAVPPGAATHPIATETPAPSPSAIQPPGSQAPPAEIPSVPATRPLEEGSMGAPRPQAPTTAETPAAPVTRPRVERSANGPSPERARAPAAEPATRPGPRRVDRERTLDPF